MPNSEDAETIQKVWDGFWVIRQDLKKDFRPGDVDVLKSKITSWLELYLSEYLTKDVTPYIHALYAHVPEFVSLYTNLEYFTQQGMEKYNDITSKFFFRSSNHRGTSALEKIFLKKNRVQYLETAGCARVKNKYTCSNCKNIGHTLKTCTAECKNCKSAICCAHLVKYNGKYHPKCTVTTDNTTGN